MGITEVQNSIIELGVVLFIAVATIAGVIFFFLKLEPRLRKIEENQICDAKEHEANRQVIENNSRALETTSQAIEGIKQALTNMESTMAHTNETNRLIWTSILQESKEKKQ